MPRFKTTILNIVIFVLVFLDAQFLLIFKKYCLFDTTPCVFENCCMEFWTSPGQWRDPSMIVYKIGDFDMICKKFKDSE